MAKPKMLTTAIVVGVIAIVCAVSLYTYVQYHPRSLDKRMHFAKRDIQKIRGQESKCYSQADCKMVILKTQECIPVDWIVSYSTRSDDVEAITDLIEDYNEFYERRHGNKFNRECVRANNPKLRCLKGQCIVKIYQGQILNN